MMMELPQIPTQGPYQAQTPQAPVSGPIGVLDQGSQIYQQGGPQPYPFYQRGWFNPLEQSGHQMQLQGGMQSVADAYNLRPLLGNLYGSAIGSMTDTMRSGGNVPPQNPYSQGAISGAVNQLTGDVMRGIMPQTDLAAVGAGQPGSSRHGVLQANALRDAGATAGNIGAMQSAKDYNAWLGAWGQGQDQLSRAWNLTPSLFSGFENAYMQPSQLMTGLGGLTQGVGAQYRGLGDQFMQDQANLWNQTQQRPYSNLQQYSGLLAGVPGGIGTQTQTSPGPSQLGNALGGAVLGYGLWDQFGSNQGNQAPATPFLNPSMTNPQLNPALAGLNSWWRP